MKTNELSSNRRLKTDTGSAPNAAWVLSRRLHYTSTGGLDGRNSALNRYWGGRQPARRGGGQKNRGGEPNTP